MGKKGTKLTQKATDACQRFVMNLASTGEITSRKMFGGYGIFESGVMFALVNAEGGIYLKINDSNISQFKKKVQRVMGRCPIMRYRVIALLHDIGCCQELIHNGGIEECG